MISTFGEHQIAMASEALIARGGRFVDLPTLLPASLVLELAGEGLRPRLFFATAPDGSELCLRPDLTIPAVVDYLKFAEFDDQPLAVACKGQVYRAPRNGEDRSPDFTQIGLERFGDQDKIATDVSVFLAALSAVQSSSAAPLHVRFCDGGLLKTIIEQADLPEVWRNILSEQTNHQRAFLATLNQASTQTPLQPASQIEQAIADMAFDEAKDQVAQILGERELVLTDARSIEDVTRRLVSRAQRVKAQPLTYEVAQKLTALAQFRQSTCLQGALDQVVELSADLGVDLSDWRDVWQHRFSEIERQNPGALQHARFDAIGEEAFDYYDGMAFDIARDENFLWPISTGGRYDRLVGEVSGGARQAHAIGCVVRPDRFAPEPGGQV